MKRVEDGWFDSWDRMLETMNVYGEASTLRHVRDVYGLNGYRIKGIVFEIDTSVVKETRESLDARYPDLKKRREETRKSLDARYADLKKRREEA